MRAHIAQARSRHNQYRTAAFTLTHRRDQDRGQPFRLALPYCRRPVAEGTVSGARKHSGTLHARGLLNGRETTAIPIWHVTIR